MPAGRPRKPNSLHVAEGTARNDRGTDLVMEIPEDFKNEPEMVEWAEFDKDRTFNMMKNWVIAATGASKIDELMLSMMADQLELYAKMKMDGDVKGMGLIVDRFHKLAREFGMTPSTRDQFVNKANMEEETSMKTILAGPE